MRLPNKEAEKTLGDYGRDGDRAAAVAVNPYPAGRNSSSGLFFPSGNLGGEQQQERAIKLIKQAKNKWNFFNNISLQKEAMKGRTERRDKNLRLVLSSLPSPRGR